MTDMPSAEKKASRRCARVMLVDDHPVVRHGLAQAIGHAGDLEVCAQAASAGDAMAAFDDAAPDVVVIDLSLEDGSGMDLIKQIKSASPNTRMLVASMHDENLYAERVLRAGAMGYINKEESMEKIVEAIQQVMRGRIYLSSNMADQVLNRVTRGDDDADQSPVETLSDRELEVFQQIGQGLTTRQIAEKLHLSPKTIETHREHIKTKLNISNNNQLVRFAAQWMIEQS
ncbi:response regulator transcription factor [Planctomycetales bacterium ZRK34]|nr:response regulator transcription factor [Planctomycetales bacterium ZRK34]